MFFFLNLPLKGICHTSESFYKSVNLNEESALLRYLSQQMAVGASAFKVLGIVIGQTYGVEDCQS